MSINKYIIGNTIELGLRVSHTLGHVVPRVNVSSGACFDAFCLESAGAIWVASFEAVFVDRFHESLLVSLSELLFQLLLDHTKSLIYN